MGKFCFFKLFAVIAIIAQVVVGQQRPLVAVLPFEARGGVSAQDAETITELFTNGLQATGQIRILTRADTDFDRILQEMQFQRTDWGDNKNVAQIGKVSGARYVVSGQINKLGNNTILTARMIDVESGEIFSSASENVRSIDEIVEKMPGFCNQIVRNIQSSRQASSTVLSQAEVEYRRKRHRKLRGLGIVITCHGWTAPIGIPIWVVNNRKAERYRRMLDIYNN